MDASSGPRARRWEGGEASRLVRRRSPLALVVGAGGCGAASPDSPPSGVDELADPDPVTGPPRLRPRHRQPVAAARARHHLALRGHRRHDRDARRSPSRTRRTTVAGVATTAVTRTEPTGDQVVDYYAQDRRGNVWWFGREGVWLAGEDGAQAGLAMPATPRLGDGWRAAYDADVVDVRMTVETRRPDRGHARPAGSATSSVSTSPTRSSPAPRGARTTSAGSAWSRRSRPKAPSTSPSCRARPAASS